MMWANSRTSLLISSKTDISDTKTHIFNADLQIRRVSWRNTN
jgi:hypothetical protein